ncbi:hypothetical protein C8J57DRAFT_227425 [Mycena rebaudengoi]|nr:hypothetical protein C8J57DRAFT_227425 [Mycena rebaudengoi]
MYPQLEAAPSRQFEWETFGSLLSVTVHNLSRALIRIFRALWISLKASEPRVSVHWSDEKQRVVKDFEKAPPQCQYMSQARAINAALKVRDAADLAFEEQAMSLLLSVKQLLDEVACRRLALETADDAFTPPDLPPAPEIFYGRDRELSGLVDMFSQDRQAHAAILGEGGSGKSSLALKFMHCPEIVQKYRHRRFLVKCDTAKGASELLACLASVLGVSDVSTKTEGVSMKSILSSLARSPSHHLIVFDDLNFAWEPPTSRLAVEDLLTELSAIPTISLFLTLRGTQRPLGPAYSKPYPRPLGPLSLPAARHLFLAISDVSTAPESLALVDVLLQHVGRLPEPVAALAHIAQYEPLPCLFARYAEEGMEMLPRAAASVELSLYSARFVAAAPAAQEVLQLLACMPDGVTMPEAMMIAGISGAKCLSVLCHTSLVVVHRDLWQEERLKVPEVVRAYLERHAWDGGRFRRKDCSSEMRTGV